MAQPIAHGGGLQAARRCFPSAPEPWIDLSTGINPVGYPLPAIPADAWTRLPEPDDVAGLERAAACAYGVADPACVVAAPGTQCLIQLIPRLIPPGTVTVCGPTYAEHAACWAAAGHTIQAGPADVTILCNPNNPDGRRHDPTALLAMDRGRLLVVDEAFADLEQISLAPALPRPGLLLLRSFGKTYGLAGLRLGFALASPGLAGAIRAALGPWAVSGPAVVVGRAALADAAWRAAAAVRLAADGARLDAMLTAAGATVLGGTLLFRLVAHPEAAALARRLAAAGILVRAFTEQPGWLRFGLPADAPAWERLRNAIG